MKLTQLIDIIDFGYNVTFITQEEFLSEKTFIQKNDGLYYWKDASIESFEMFDAPAMYLKKMQIIEKQMDVLKTDCEFSFYYALLSCFMSAGAWLKRKEPSFDIMDYALYYTLIHIHILTDEIKNNLDFSQVKDMKTLIKQIQNDHIFYQKMFFVNVFDYDKNQQENLNENHKKFQFGNLQYHAPTNKIFVDLYRDVSVIKHEKTKIEHKLGFNVNQSGNLEKTILDVIHEWKEKIHL